MPYHGLVAADEVALEGHPGDDGQVLARQLPVVIEQRCASEVLQRIERGALHGQVFHGFVGGGTEQTGGVVAIDLIKTTA